jgi:hypothetical protein
VSNIICNVLVFIWEHSNKHKNTEVTIGPESQMAAVSEIQAPMQYIETSQPNRDSGYFDTDIEPETIAQHHASPMSFTSGSYRSRMDDSNNSSQCESDSSFMTDNSMMSDDSAGYTSSENTSSNRGRRTEPLEEEVWEIVDESGNIIETRIIRSKILSSIYEVENNGNYQKESSSDSSTPTMEVCNANYQSSLSESINFQFNERRNVSNTPNNQASSNQSSPKRKLPEQRNTYPSKYQNKSVYMSSYIQSEPEPYKSGSESDTEEEVWETIEETVDTPPEILRAILANQGKI